MDPDLAPDPARRQQKTNKKSFSAYYLITVGIKGFLTIFA
jgi:hypothetical protein